MIEAVRGCRSLIIGDTNLPLLGTRFSYDDYQQFYEDTFIPMKISEEQLLTVPEDIVQPDIEDQEEPQEDSDDDGADDFDFGDDFW